LKQKLKTLKKKYHMDALFDQLVTTPVAAIADANAAENESLGITTEILKDMSRIASDLVSCGLKRRNRLLSDVSFPLTAVGEANRLRDRLAAVLAQPKLFREQKTRIKATHMWAIVRVVAKHRGHLWTGSVPLKQDWVEASVAELAAPLAEVYAFTAEQVHSVVRNLFTNAQLWFSRSELLVDIRTTASGPRRRARSDKGKKRAVELETIPLGAAIVQDLSGPMAKI